MGKLNLPYYHELKIVSFRAFTQAIRVIPEGEKVWLKVGNDLFFHGEVNYSGNFGGWTTRLDHSKEDKKPHLDSRWVNNLFEYLRNRSKYEEGGVFYLPGLPTEQPWKEYCVSSRDLGAELDEGDADEQLARYREFTKNSGLIAKFIAGSGGKSQHAHWQLGESIDIEERNFLSRLLCIALHSDPAVTNPHQPMRMPGFYRKTGDKVTEQPLNFYSESTYTPEEFLTGLRKAFEAINLRFPETLPDWRWKKCRRICAQKVEAGVKRKKLREALAITDEEHERKEKERQAELEAKKEQQRLSRALRQLQGKVDLVEEINRVEESLDPYVAFYWSGHHWKERGNHPRGYCPWHESATGTAGWISNRNGKIAYHCPVCTDNKGLSPFAYWRSLKTGSIGYPKGKEFVESAKEFLGEHGVFVDNPPPQIPTPSRKDYPVIKISRREEEVREKEKLITLKYSFTRLKNNLGKWEKQKSLEKFVICPDPGDIKKLDKVNFWAGVGELLEPLNKPIFVRWHDGLLWSLKKFLELAKQTCGFLDRAELEKLESTAKHKKKKRRWERSYKFTSDYKINKKYLQGKDLKKHLRPGVILCIKSGLGTNKTGAVGDVLNTVGDGVILAGYRNTLLTQTCERWGNFHHLHNDKAFQFISDPLSRLALCLDSSLHIGDEDFEKRLLVVDEPVSVFNHGVNGGTLGKKQQQVLKKLSFFLHDSKAIVVADGNLSDYEVELIKALAPEKEVVKIENTYRGRGANIIMTNGVDAGKVRTRDKSHLLNLINSYNRTAIATDSQKLAEVLDEILSQAGREVFRVDSETIHLEEVQQFLRNPRAYLEENQPDTFIYSPSMESGSDVNYPGYFEAQFCFLQGVLRTSSQVQLIFRIRDLKIPRYVFCAKQGLPSRNSHNPRSYSAYGLDKARTELLEELNQAVLWGENQEIQRLSLAIQSLRKSDPYEKYYQRIKAREYFEERNLQECLARKLELARHKVEHREIEIVAAEKDLLKDVREKLLDIRSEQIFNAEDIPEIELEKYVNSAFGGTPELRRKLEKAFLKKRLPGIEKKDVWGVGFIRKTLSDQGMISEIRQRHLLSDRQSALTILKKELFHLYEHSQGFVGSLRSPYLRTLSLAELGIPQVIEKGMVGKEDVLVQSFWEQIQDFKVRQRLGVNPYPPREDGSEIMRSLGKVLGLVGYKLKRIQVRVGEERINRYEVVDKYPEYSAPIGECLTELFKDSQGDPARLTNLLRKGETATQQIIPLSHTPSNKRSLMEVSVPTIYPFRTISPTPHSDPETLNWYGQPLGNYHPGELVAVSTPGGIDLALVVRCEEDRVWLNNDESTFSATSTLDLIPTNLLGN